MKVAFKVIIALLLVVNSISLFSNSPDVSFFAGTSSGSAIKISPLEDKVIVGFTNGYIKLYDLNGYWYSSMYSHNSKIIDIEWPSGYGPITLDSSGKAIRWSSSGSLMYTWQFNQTVYDMSVSVDSYYPYIAFNLGDRIQEYYLSSGALVRTYFAQGGSQFRRIQYSASHYYIFVSTNTAYVQIYSCSSGTSIGYSIYTSGSMRAFSLMSDGYTVVGLTTNNYIYKITTGGVYYYLGSFVTSTTMTVCPYTNLIATAESYYADIGIYDTNGFFQQYLTYMSGYGQGLDCSSNHIASIDEYGYVYINSYSSFPAWAIALISVGGCLIICSLIVITAVRARRRRRAMQGFDQYGRIDNTIPSNQPYINNNQGYQPGPVYSPVNQGYNNPSFNNQPPINNNPYQANQPRNWN